MELDQEVDDFIDNLLCGLQEELQEEDVLSSQSGISDSVHVKQQNRESERNTKGVLPVVERTCNAKTKPSDEATCTTNIHKPKSSPEDNLPVARDKCSGKMVLSNETNCKAIQTQRTEDADNAPTQIEAKGKNEDENVDSDNLDPYDVIDQISPFIYTGHFYSLDYLYTVEGWRECMRGLLNNPYNLRNYDINGLHSMIFMKLEVQCIGLMLKFRPAVPFSKIPEHGQAVQFLGSMSAKGVDTYSGYDVDEVGLHGLLLSLSLQSYAYFKLNIEEVERKDKYFTRRRRKGKRSSYHRVTVEPFPCCYMLSIYGGLDYVDVDYCTRLYLTMGVSYGQRFVDDFYAYGELLDLNIKLATLRVVFYKLHCFNKPSTHEFLRSIHETLNRIASIHRSTLDGGYPSDIVIPGLVQAKVCKVRACAFDLCNQIVKTLRDRIATVYLPESIVVGFLSNWHREENSDGDKNEKGPIGADDNEKDRLHGRDNMADSATCTRCDGVINTH